MSNPFDGGDTTESETAVATLDPQAEAETADEADADLDVDVDTAAETNDEVETIATPPVIKGATVKKVGEKATTSTRRPVAEGYVAPVEAAKALSRHLTTKAREAGQIGEDQEVEVKPQVMYSYIKNNGPESKNPLPRYTDAALTGGRECVVKVEEVIEWWEAKDTRVAERKANAKAKADKKAENAKKETAAVVEAEDKEPAAPVVEAE